MTDPQTPRAGSVVTAADAPTSGTITITLDGSTASVAHRPNETLLESARREFGGRLDFVPIVRERYMLTGRNATLGSPAVEELCALLRGEAFARLMEPVAGYEPDAPGDVVRAGELFGWVGR